MATVSRLNGCFGLADGGAVTDALSGGLAGLAKTAGHEWPEVACKAFDLSAGLTDVNKSAEMLVAELLVDGVQEVGFSTQGLQMLSLVEEALSGEKLASPVEYGDVVVVSGGAANTYAGTTTINTMVYNFGADYKYNPHLSFTLAYSLTDSKLPGNAAANFQANALTLSAAFRY